MEMIPKIVNKSVHMLEKIDELFDEVRKIRLQPVGVSYMRFDKKLRIQVTGLTSEILEKFIDNDWELHYGKVEEGGDGNGQYMYQLETDMVILWAIMENNILIRRGNNG